MKSSVQTVTEKSLQLQGISPWILLLLAGLLFAFLYAAYRRERALVPPRAGVSILALRLAAAAALVSLLLELVSATITREEHRGKILLAIDGSRSMSLRDENLEGDLKARIELVQAVLAQKNPEGKSFLERLGERFEVLPLFLGGSPAPFAIEGADSLKLPAPDGDATDLSAPVLNAAAAVQRGELAAVFLFSDGCHNRGQPPEEAARILGDLEVPLFTAGAGAAEAPPDLAIAAIEGPARVFAGDTVEAVALLRAHGLAKRAVTAAVHSPGAAEAPSAETLLTEAPLAKATAEIAPERREVRVPLSFAAGGAGQRRLRISVPVQEGERLGANNQKDFWIQVEEGKAKVLYVEDRPRWDYRFLTTALSQSKNAALETILVRHEEGRARLPENFPQDRNALFQHDLLILGDVDAALFSKEQLQAIRDFAAVRGGAVVFLAGPRRQPRSFAETPAAELIPVSFPAAASATGPHPASGSKFTSGQPWPGGGAFQLSPAGLESPLTRLLPERDLNARLWELFPPASWCAPASGVKPGAELLVQLVDPAARAGAARGAGGAAAGKIAPAMVSGAFGAGRVLYLGIDELFRLRYQTGGLYFSKLWSQVVRWATSSRLLEGDGFVQIGADSVRYLEKAPVALRAVVRGKDGEPFAGELVEARLVEKKSGAETAIRLRPIPDGGGLYVGSAEGLPEGEYRARLEAPGLAEYRSVPLEKRAAAEFVIERPPDRELEDAVCDVRRLEEMARLSGGQYRPARRAAELLDHLPQKNYRTETSTRLEQWDFSWWFLIVFAALLSIEWAVRKKFDLL